MTKRPSKRQIVVDLRGGSGQGQRIMWEGAVCEWAGAAMYVGRINYTWKSLFQIDQRTHIKRLTDRQRYGQINGQMDGRTEFVLQMELPSYL